MLCLIEIAVNRIRDHGDGCSSMKNSGSYEQFSAANINLLLISTWNFGITSPIETATHETIYQRNQLIGPTPAMNDVVAKSGSFRQLLRVSC